MGHSRKPLDPHVSLGACEIFDRDMTATIAADVSLEAVQRRLAEVNQWLPIDGDPGRTVGQLVERNSTGPLRLGYGGWRDLLLGVQFNNGRGDLITAGGRAVKNVAGYDLTKLMVGQEGLLGQLVTITTRTYRRPAGAILAAFEPDARGINRLLPMPVKPQWAVLTSTQLWCGYLGDARTLDYHVASLARLDDPRPQSVQRRSLEDDVAHRHALFGAVAAQPGAFRASVPPMRIAEFVALCRPNYWVADAAHGIVVGATDDAGSPGSASESAQAVGGSARYNGSRTLGNCFRAGPEADLMKRLKTAFDHENMLYPLWQS